MNSHTQLGGLLGLFTRGALFTPSALQSTALKGTRSFSAAVANRVQGRLTMYDSTKYFGFVRSKKGDQFMAHGTQMRFKEGELRIPRIGAPVEFDAVSSGGKRGKAINITAPGGKPMDSLRKRRAPKKEKENVAVDTKSAKGI